MDELRKKTIVGSVWMLFERFGYLTIQFVSNLVLARLLMPDDFGAIGIMMVFITLSNILIDSGFSASLIQKKEITEVDKSTVFYINLIMSASVYALIFFGSPLAADYFRMPILEKLLRVLGVVVLIDALCAIQNTLLTREMNFKLLTQIKLFSIIIAASIAIYLAYSGWGIWALIIQYIIYSTIRTSTTWIVSKWRPVFAFSKQSFRTLFGYGSKLLFSTFVAELYVNFQQILIGRFYTPSDLGYYSQARQFQQIPTGTISQVINSVAFPAYSKIQNEKQKLREMFRQNIRIVSFLNTPLMVLLAVVAKPLIIMLYSSKWIGSIEYFQFLCICFGILLSIHQCSLSVLKAVGKSDYVLKLEIIKKILGVLLIIVGINIWGLWGILYALGFNSFIELFLNGYYVNKELNYSGFGQLLDLIPSLLCSLIAGLSSYYILNYYLSESNPFISVVITSILFLLFYLLLAFIGKVYGFNIFKKSIQKIISKKIKK